MPDYYTLEDGTEREHLEDIEKEIYVDRLTITYEGLFDYKDLLKLINDWAREKKYYKEITSSKEKVTKIGKNIEIEFQFQRKIPPLNRSLINMGLSVEDMTDVKQEMDGQLKNLHNAIVEVVFHSYLASSIRARWETRGYVAFIRGIINKFVYKFDRPARAGVVVGETKDLAFKIRGFLNSYPKRIKEETKEAAIKESRMPEIDKAKEERN